MPGDGDCRLRNDMGCSTQAFGTVRRNAWGLDGGMNDWFRTIGDFLCDASGRPGNGRCGQSQRAVGG